MRELFELNKVQFDRANLCPFCTKPLPTNDLPAKDLHLTACSHAHGPYKCPYCPQVRSKFWDRHYHVQKSHCNSGSSTYTCGECKAGFESRTEVSNHKRKV